MSSILSIPREVFLIIAHYLLGTGEQNKLIFKYNQDWTNFMNCKKAILGEIKRQTRILVLERRYADKYLRSTKFKERILSLIASPVDQLELRFKFTKLQKGIADILNGVNIVIADNCSVEGYPSAVNELILNQCSLSQLPPKDLSVNKFTMKDCNICSEKNVIDVSCLNILEVASFSVMQLQNYQFLAHLKSLTIEFTNSVTDVSCFKDISKLKFNQCPYITEVSSLANVHELELLSCDGIADVSSLGNVYSLSLAGCQNVRDVSALGNVSILNLSHCKEVKDVSALTNVSELNLVAFQGNDLSGLNNVVKLVVGSSPFISDISMLRNVEELYMEHCIHVSGFEGLNKLKKLSIGNGLGAPRPFRITSGKEIFLQLEELTAISVDFNGDPNESKDKNDEDVMKLCWQDFPTVLSLNLQGCAFNRFPPLLYSRLYSLTLSRCQDISVIPYLPALGGLVIEHCLELTRLQISPVGNDNENQSNDQNHEFPISSVSIHACSSLEQMTISRKISELLIANCRSLSSLVVERQVNSLLCKNCTKLKEVPSSALVVYQDHQRDGGDIGK
jgi:hypothetical protein